MCANVVGRSADRWPVPPRGRRFVRTTPMGGPNCGASAASLSHADHAPIPARLRQRLLPYRPPAPATGPHRDEIGEGGRRAGRRVLIPAAMRGVARLAEAVKPGVRAELSRLGRSVTKYERTIGRSAGAWHQCRRHVRPATDRPAELAGEMPCRAVDFESGDITMSTRVGTQRLLLRREGVNQRETGLALNVLVVPLEQELDRYCDVCCRLGQGFTPSTTENCCVDPTLSGSVAMHWRVDGGDGEPASNHEAVCASEDPGSLLVLAAAVCHQQQRCAVGAGRW